MNYTNYIFDLYGTLVDIHTDESDPELWERMALYLSYRGMADVRPEELSRQYTDLCEEEKRKAEAALAKRRIPGPAEIDVVKVWKKLIMQNCGTASQKAAADAAQLFRALSMVHLRLYDGAAEVLKELRNRGKKIVLLTNAQSCFTVPELKMLGLDGLFDRVFISSEEGVKKPSPAFFAKPAEAGFLPGESLMVGNDAGDDCRGAAAAGMDSVYIHTAQSPDGPAELPENCVRIGRLDEIL